MVHITTIETIKNEGAQMILSAFAQTSSGIEAGATYRRKGTGAFVETARVIEVSPDKMGIPHVRYQLWVQRGAGKPSVETRTLSLEAFSTRFRQRMKDSH